MSQEKGSKASKYWQGWTWARHGARATLNSHLFLHDERRQWRSIRFPGFSKLLRTSSKLPYIRDFIHDINDTSYEQKSLSQCPERYYISGTDGYFKQSWNTSDSSAAKPSQWSAAGGKHTRRSRWCKRCNTFLASQADLEADTLFKFVSLQTICQSTLKTVGIKERNCLKTVRLQKETYTVYIYSLRNPSAGKKRDGQSWFEKTRWKTKIAIKPKKCDKYNDFAKLRHPQPRSLLSLGAMDSENWFCGNKR